MKKLLALLLVLIVAFSFVACNKNESDKVGTVTVVEFVEGGEAKEYQVGLSKLSEPYNVLSAMEYLKKEGKVEFEYSGTGDSAYVTKFGALTNDATTGRYIYIYTSVEADWDVSEYKMEMTYKEQKLVSSGVGISKMTLKDGAVIYIGLISWS